MRRRILAAIAMSIVIVAALLMPTAQANNTFTDVPNSNIFHDEIDWLADAGITLGCNAGGTQFCPDAAVTRGQMAAFMNRLVTHLDAQPEDPTAAKMFYHQVTTSNLSGYITFLDHPDLNGNPDALVSATHMWGNGNYVLDIGTWYNGVQWTVFTENVVDLPVGEEFSITYIADRNG